MKKKLPKDQLVNLSSCAGEFIKLVIKKMRYRKKVRADVQAELAAHFEDELRECKTNEEKEQKAQKLIEQFGDAKLLGVLLHRAKKRCRPLWRTIVARAFQAIGVLVICFIMYAAWFLTGRPAVTIDYLKMWNEISKPEITDGDNAWINYEKAIELFAEPNESLQDIIKKNYLEFGDLDKLEQKQIIDWIEDNQAAWQEFVKGSLCPYYYRKSGYDGDPNDPYQKMLIYVLMPHLSSLRDLARLGTWRSKLGLETGRIEQSLDDTLTVIRAGRHLQGKGCLIEQLVGTAMSGFGCNQTLNIMFEHKLSSALLSELERNLKRVYRKGYPEVNMEGEKLMFLDTVQHTFTNTGPGGGHLVPEGIPTLEGLSGSKDREVELLRVITYTGGCMIHARRDATIEKYNEIYDKLNEIVKMSPYQRHINNVATSEEILEDLPRYRYFLISILMPVVERVSEITYQGKASYEATITVSALLRWRLENGLYPDQLGRLVKDDYLKELPMDPYSDKPLVYKRTDDGFILYSVSYNFIDDGGKPGRDNKDKIRRWVDEGDAVFWPVQN